MKRFEIIITCADTLLHAIPFVVVTLVGEIPSVSDNGFYESNYFIEIENYKINGIDTAVLHSSTQPGCKQHFRPPAHSSSVLHWSCVSQL